MPKSDPKPERATLNVEEAAKIAGCGPGSIRKGIKAGEIPYIAFGRRIVLPRAPFMRWLNSAGEGSAFQRWMDRAGEKVAR